MPDRHGQRIASVVRQAAHQHFPGQDTHAVKISTAIYFLPTCLFRRHVGRAAHRQPGIGQAWVAATPQGDTEISQQRSVGLIE